MAEIASAYLSILPSLRGMGPALSKEMNSPAVRKAAATSGDKVGKAMGGRVSSGLKSLVGGAIAGIGVAGVTSFFSSAISSASDLNETVNKANVIFGENSAQVQKWAQGAAKNLGLPREAALAASAGLGNMLQQLGYTGEAAAKTSMDTVKLAADLGSFNNLPTGDVLERINAALRGEYDSLQQVIPNINAARVEQEALAMTGKSAASSLTAQEKAAATLAIVQRDGAAANNDFAETSGGLANQTKIASAQFQDMKASLGTQLMPAMTSVMGFISTTALPALQSFGRWFSENKTTVMVFAGAIAGLTAVLAVARAGTVAYNAVQGVQAVLAGRAAAQTGLQTTALIAQKVALGASTAATKVMTVAQRALNLVMRANPIGIVITAIGALVGALVWLYRNNETARRIIDGAWRGIRTAISAVGSWFTNTLWPGMQRTIGWIGNAFTNVKNAIGRAWNGIKAAAAKPINFVLGTVYNDGIAHWWNTIAKAVGLSSLKLPKASLVKFASGGVLPGYTPGRDVHEFFSPTAGRLSLSGGEAIMRPEFTRAVGGPAGVAALNAAARRGQAFADGGVWGKVGTIAGDVWDKVKGAAKGVVDFLKDPAGSVTRGLGSLVNRLLGGIGGGNLGKIAGALPGKFVGGLANWVKSSLSVGAPSTGGSGPMGAGTTQGIANMTAAVKALDPTARITSSLRRGAVTATGYRSYHSMGRAIDIVSANMGRTWDLLRQRYGQTAAELYYTPRGFLRRGKPVSVAPVTRRTHYSHVHWAMANGGVLPKLYDQGGWMPSGGVGVNLSGKPEAVLTPDESDLLKALVAGSGSGKIADQIILNDARELFAEKERADRRAMTRARIGVRRP